MGRQIPITIFPAGEISTPPITKRPNANTTQGNKPRLLAPYIYIQLPKHTPPTQGSPSENSTAHPPTQDDANRPPVQPPPRAAREGGREADIDLAVQPPVSRNWWPARTAAVSCGPAKERRERVLTRQQLPLASTDTNARVSAPGVRCSGACVSWLVGPAEGHTDEYPTRKHHYQSRPDRQNKSWPSLVWIRDRTKQGAVKQCSSVDC